VSGLRLRDCEATVCDDISQGFATGAGVSHCMSPVSKYEGVENPARRDLPGKHVP